MGNNTTSENYCNYSFDDLYFAAYKKSLSDQEKNNLQELQQDEVNALVSEWAKKAHWKTMKKIGSDKKVYLAFEPED